MNHSKLFVKVNRLPIYSFNSMGLSGIKKVAQVLQVFRVDFMRLCGFFGFHQMAMAFHFIQSMVGEERRNHLIVTAEYSEDAKGLFLLNNQVLQFRQEAANGSHFEQRVFSKKSISQGRGPSL